MNSLSASLLFWLKSQCQTYDKVTQSLLALAPDKAPAKILATFPETTDIPPAMMDAITHVGEKQRLYLAHMNDQQLVLGHPVFLHNHYWGAVVIQLEVSGKTATQHAIKTLQKGLVWLQFLLHEQQKIEQRQPKQNSDNASFIKGLLKENSLQETAIHFVNTLASLLHANRVSVGWRTSQGITLAAVSASASFDARTEAMQLVANTMLEACDQGTDIHVVKDQTTELSTTVVHHHQQLLQQHGLQSVHTIVLRKDQRLLGALIIEHAQQTQLRAAEKTFLQSLLPVIADIVQLKQRAEAGVWQNLKERALLRLTKWFGDQKRGLKITGGLGIATLVILLLPFQYHVSSDANLQSIYKHLLVAPQDGYLKAINARPGDLVKKGDVLAQLNDDELRLEERKVRSQRQQFQQEYDNALASSNRVEAAIANAKVDQADIQLRLLAQQSQRTQLLAPADGIVVSDDISQTLGAPLKQGDVLFEIAANSGYRVQLFVNESDVTAIQVGQEGHVKLRSLPNETFEFTVTKITPISEVREGRNFFRVEADLAREVPELRTGMTGSGKIAVGRRPLIWIWFHDIWHWLRLSLWW